MSGSRAVPSDSRVNGMLFVDKPAGITSHDVVSVVRRAARMRRVGHAGTLDPFATGLLVVAVGTATRLLPYLAGEPKVYDATFTFGNETETDDATGAATQAAALPDWRQLDDAIASLTGDIAQVPPAFSAKQVDGQRAYAVARRGGALVLPSVNVRVHQWIVRAVHHDTVDVRIVCAGGTYIRALARDLGRALHSAAHCRDLRRVSSGTATVAQATPLSELTPGAVADHVVSLHSPLALLEPMAHEPLDETGIAALAHGRTVRATCSGARAALLCEGEVVGIADRVAGDRWQPRVVLLPSAGQAPSGGAVA
jgi:tRNA pseudouridine55 synthase